MHPPFFLVYEARLSRWTAQPGRKSGALRLKGADFVNILVDGDLVTATTKGEAFGLDRATGQLLWHNKLPGLGMGLVTIATAAGSSLITPLREKRKRDEAAGAAAASAA